MDELLINNRPSRAIKRRRFEDDMLEETNLDPIFMARPSMDDVSDGATPQPDLTQSSKPNPVSRVPPKVPKLAVNGAIPKKVRPTRNPGTSLSKKSTIANRLQNRTKFYNKLWRAEDDLLLIDGVLQTMDLHTVFIAVNFSTYFTLQEIQQRWYSLLYHQNISKTALERIDALSIDVKTRVLSKALYSEPEEQILMDLNSNKLPSLEVFSSLLSKHESIFHQSRTPKALRKHWLLLRRYQLLTNQGVNSSTNQDQFSDTEERIIDTTEADEVNPALTDPSIRTEIALADLRAKEEIKQLETEIPRWQFLLSQITNQKNPEFGEKTFAVLRGRSYRYLMCSREITIGRSCRGNAVDVDLSLEGPAHKISRIQGIIKLMNTGVIIFQNQGKRPVFIDGKAVLPGQKRRLNDNSIIIICKLALLFLINQALVSKVYEEFKLKVLSNNSADAPQDNKAKAS